MNWFSSQPQPIQPPMQSSSSSPSPLSMSASNMVEQKKNADLLKQCIMQCIVAKNAADRTKNYWKGTSNASEREAQIREVLTDILNTPNLSQVMVVDHIASTMKTGLSKMKQASKYGYNTFRNRFQRPAAAPAQGGRKSRRRRK